MDIVTDDLRRCYIEMDEFWVDEVQRATEALKNRRVDPEDIERWRNFGRSLEHIIADRQAWIPPTHRMSALSALSLQGSSTDNLSVVAPQPTGNTRLPVRHFISLSLFVSASNRVGPGPRPRPHHLISIRCDKSHTARIGERSTLCLHRGRIRQADPLFVHSTSRGQVLGEPGVLRRVPSRVHPIWNSCGDGMHRIRILFPVFPDEKLAGPRRPRQEARDGKDRGICSVAHPDARYGRAFNLGQRVFWVTLRRVRYEEIQHDPQGVRVVAAEGGSEAPCRI